EHIILSEEFLARSELYGSYFNLEEYRKLYLYLELSILFEESTDLDAVKRYTFNLIVTFGDAQSAFEYLLAYQDEQKNKIELELEKHKLFPCVYKAIQFSPLPPPDREEKSSYDVSAFNAWRMLVNKKTADGIYI